MDYVRYAAQFSPDGRLVVASGDKLIAAWHSDTGRLAWTAPLHGVRGRLLRFGPGGQTLLVGTDGGAVYLVDPRDGHTLRTLGRLKEWVTGGAISPDGRLAVAGDIKGGLGCWETATGREYQLPSLPAFTRLEMATFSPDGAYLLLGGRGAGAQGGVDLVAAGLRDQSIHARVPSGELQAAMGADFSADGRLVAVGFWGGRFELLRFPELDTVWSQRLDEWVFAARFVDEESRLLAVGPKKIHLLDASDGQGHLVLAAPEPNWIIDAFDLTQTEDRLLVVRRGFRRVQVLRYPLEP